MTDAEVTTEGSSRLPITPQDRPTFVTHLECSKTGKEYPADQPYGLSEAGAPLVVRYDLEAVAATVAPADLSDRAADMWRYRELLPVRRSENIVSLGESITPLIELGEGANVLVKDESRLPTYSFKARGMAIAVSRAKELGLTRLAMATNGNAGAALAAYGSRAGMETFVFCPADTPEINVREIAIQGARVWRIDGLIDECGRVVEAGGTEGRWFDVSTLKEPYRIEGKKTMALELVDQLGWRFPDVIFYPTGGGTGLIGMWKVFGELLEMGWVEGQPPRMVAVQASGCAPIVKAFEQGADSAEPWPDAQTIASGIRVPEAIGDFLMLDAVRSSGGFALAVDDEDILSAQIELAGRDGLLTSPEGAATYAGYLAARADGRVGPNELAILFNCGNGLKYPMPPADDWLDHRGDIDFDRIV